jgi:hypothetical protein
VASFIAYLGGSVAAAIMGNRMNQKEGQMNLAKNIKLYGYLATTLHSLSAVFASAAASVLLA